MTDFDSLNHLGINEEIEDRLNQIQGILITLESAMESRDDFITIQPIAKYSVTAALKMAEECGELNTKAFKLLPRKA